MTETTYTHTIDVDALHKLMTSHVDAVAKANDAAFSQILTKDEAEVARYRDEELDAVTEANSIAFHIADMLLTDELRQNFIDSYNAAHAE